MSGRSKIVKYALHGLIVMGPIILIMWYLDKLTMFFVLFLFVTALFGGSVGGYWGEIKNILGFGQRWEGY